MGSYDVGALLAMYEQDDQPTVQPMHGSKGEVRRNPSTDQKKERRKMTVQKQACDEPAEAETLPQLLARAARADTLTEQQDLMGEYERRTTERMASLDAARALDLSVKQAVEIIPRGTHELHTEQTDWLLSEGLHVTASMADAEHTMVAEASMWFGRVPGYVKEDQEEFRTQAVNKATYLASQYGEHADSVRQAFITESERLYRQAAKTGAFTVKTASSLQEGMLPRPEPDDSVHGMTPDFSGTVPSESPHQDPEHPHRPKLHTRLPERGEVHTPGLDSEVERLKGAHDAHGVREMAEGYAAHTLRGGSLQTVAALHAAEDTQLAAALAGVGMDSAEDALDSTSKGVREDAEQFAQSQLDDQQRQAASQVPQVGLPADSFPTGVPGYPDIDTSSNKAPALREIAEFTGWDGTSVVPQGDPGATAMNNDAEPSKDFASTTHAAKVAAQLTKESAMTEHVASCPTCNGSGQVRTADRRTVAYSGLPQIDQIVNADETPGETPLPEQVAFPWQMDPNSVGRTIQEAEQQIATRPQGRPGAPGSRGGPGGSVTSAQHQANGRDNSGWMGDDGAKGLDYPGYSTPAYDGSNNLGQPDPVYGYGGDNGNQPLAPYGEEEANDVTNNPPVTQFDYSGPNDAGQGYRSVSPGMNTQGAYQGLHQDPVIAQAQQMILNRQAELRHAAAGYPQG